MNQKLSAAGKVVLLLALILAPSARAQDTYNFYFQKSQAAPAPAVTPPPEPAVPPKKEEPPAPAVQAKAEEAPPVLPPKKFTLDLALVDLSGPTDWVSQGGIRVGLSSQFWGMFGVDAGVATYARRVSLFNDGPSIDGPSVDASFLVTPIQAKRSDGSDWLRVSGMAGVTYFTVSYPGGEGLSSFDPGFFERKSSSAFVPHFGARVDWMLSRDFGLGAQYRIYGSAGGAIPPGTAQLAISGQIYF